jgi:mono/diheme cytochrome c family protein
MSRRSVAFAGIAIAALAGSAYTFGGWAVTTMDDLPEYLTVGQPVDIAFKVRQHGAEPTSGLKPVVIATDGRSEVRVAAMPKGLGTYHAPLVVPRAGDWTITINTEFRPSDITLRPIPAIASGATPPRARPAAERGERLFIAKGCVTCHVHSAVAGSGNLKVGPDLTPKRYQAEYLAKFLADPSIARTPGVTAVMPKLELKPTEIAALTAFLNNDRQVSAK